MCPEISIFPQTVCSTYIFIWKICLSEQLSALVSANLEQGWWASPCAHLDAHGFSQPLTGVLVVLTSAGLFSPLLLDLDSLVSTQSAPFGLFSHTSRGPPPHSHKHGRLFVYSLVCLSFSWTIPDSVDLAVLELTPSSRLVLNSQPPEYLAYRREQSLQAMKEFEVFSWAASTPF